MEDDALYGEDVEAALGEVDPFEDTRFMSDREFMKYLDRLFTAHGSF